MLPRRLFPCLASPSGPVRRFLALIIAAAATGAPAWPAAAQRTYELGDDDRWVDTESAAADPAEARLLAAMRSLAEDDPDRAEFLASEWIEQNKDHPRLADAYVLRGDALAAHGDFYLALFDYEVVARQFPGSEAFVVALGRELDIATRFANGLRRRLWGLRIVSADEEAEELLIRVQERLPGSRLAEQAGITLGDFYFSRRQMDLAAEMYAIFIENYPRSEDVGKARKRLVYAHLASFKGPEFDSAGLYEARARLQRLKVVDPVAAQQMGADALLTRIDESDARKLLTTAAWYLRTDDPIGAEMTIRRLVRQYPRTSAASEALDLLPSILPRLSDAVRAGAPDYAQLGANVAPRPTVPARDGQPTGDREPVRIPMTPTGGGGGGG